MPTPTRLVPVLGLLLAATAWSAPRIPTVAAPAAATPGVEYETAIPALPPGVEEFELFLLPDDGSGRAIRLTPEHEGPATSLRWRMPRVDAATARLVLRAGGRFGETESEPSAPFAVEPASPRERFEVLRGEDELAWHFGGDAAEAGPLLLPPGAATIAAATRALVAVEPTRGAGARAPSPAARPAGRAAPASAATAATAPLPRRPAFVPLRN